MHQKTLMFDIGGVLLETSGKEGLLRLLDASADRVDALERWLASPAVQRFERGHMHAGEFADAFIEEWNLQVSREEFLADFSTWVIGYYPGVEELLKSLRSTYKMVCLSNANEIHWPHCKRIEGHFDRMFASHQTGFVKPDRETFEFVLSELGEKPENIYFFDDLASNVEAARALGINAFQVNGFSELQQILRKEMLHPAQ